MKQQIGTFDELFPILNNGGVYLCEDVHSSYFPSLGGKKGGPGTFIELAKQLMDEMHDWYHAPLEDLQKSYMAGNLHSVSVYDSIVVFEKRIKNPPITLSRGTAGHTVAPLAATFHDLRRVFNIPD